MAVYIWGLAGIAVFYIAMLCVGIWAGTKQKDHSDEEVMLAGRSIGTFVGVLTLIATWVGGAYINGTAEIMYTTGLAWCQVPFGYSASLLFSMVLFVRKMREANYVTMLDPFQQKYGSRVGGLMYLPAALGDIFWVASILNALGSSLVVILGINNMISVIASTVFAASYTLVGGFYSVSYTDVLQLCLIVIGLILSAPFAYNNPYMPSDALSSTDWAGELKTQDLGEWFDIMLQLIFGGIPWQGYFQRIFSMKSTRGAQVLSFVSFFGCIAMAIPPAFIGIVAKSTDWTQVEGFNRTVSHSEGEIILPLVLRYLTPNWVSFVGLGAISAAVMSSADASILSCSSMFSRNIYKGALRPSAGEREMVWVLRITIIVVSTFAASIALSVGSIYYLSNLCSDLVYVLLFPQLLLVIHWSNGVNTYGCLSSLCVGLILRILGGEKGLDIPAIMKFPYYDEETKTQKIPFKTICMLCSLITHILVSKFATTVFESRLLDADKWDYLDNFNHMSRRRSVLSVNDRFEGLIMIDELKLKKKKKKEGISNPALETESTDTDKIRARYNNSTKL